MSLSTVQKYERRETPTRPGRATVIALADAVGLNIDEALRMVGYEPLTAPERVTAPLLDARGELDALWPALTPDQRRLLVTIAATILSRPLPCRGDGASSATGFLVETFPSGVAARVKAAARRR